MHANPSQPEEVRKKYVWLAEYWNKAVGVSGILPKV
jgi:hypothetical protein